MTDVGALTVHTGPLRPASDASPALYIRDDVDVVRVILVAGPYRPPSIMRPGTIVISLEEWSAITSQSASQPEGLMGRTGSCYDNAVAESFFASLKSEIGTRVWATRARARRAVFAHLTYYNRHRLHSTLNHRTPYEARICYRQPDALAA